MLHWLITFLCFSLTSLVFLCDSWWAKRQRVDWLACSLSFVYTQIQIIVLCLVPLIAPIPVASADGWEARGWKVAVSMSGSTLFICISLSSRWLLDYWTLTISLPRSVCHKFSGKMRTLSGRFFALSFCRAWVHIEECTLRAALKCACQHISCSLVNISHVECVILSWFFLLSER
jgi:hypothetical protein